VFSGMFPILPGKEDAARAWIAEASGPRREGWDEMQRKSELTRETHRPAAPRHGGLRPPAP
jgi:hypothetical protein